jgi:glutamine amidotransferase
MKNKKVVIIDLELGNLFSVTHTCLHIGLEPIVSGKKEDVADADALILPGVGAFGYAMDRLEKLDLIHPIKDFIQTGKPFMGICLGMQLLFSGSEEFGYHKGLDIIKGEIVKFPATDDNGDKIKIPQIGWNQIYQKENRQDSWQSSPLKGLENQEYMYFVHSYYARPENKSCILSLTNYCNVEYTSSIISGNVFATQFHPEKSAEKGINIYKTWSQLIK